MRILIISLLLASAAATPALAGPGDWGGERAQTDEPMPRVERQQTREERQQVREDRPAPAFERPERVEQREPQSNPGFASGRGSVRGDDSGFGAPRSEAIEEVQQRFRERQSNREAGGWRRGGAITRDGDFRQSERPTPGVMRPRNPLVVSEVPRPGTQPPVRDIHRPLPAGKWDGSWRKDHRYDWKRHRRDHRWVFRLGVYSDPFGWGYRPYEIGWRMWPSYYGRQYWLRDPWMYRLPYAPPGYAWIRYWDDALLVDTFTGTVADRIPNFFW